MKSKNYWQPLLISIVNYRMPNYNMKKSASLFIINIAIVFPTVLFAQTNTDTVVTLKQCVEFALRNQPAVRQASIDEQINERNIKISLADWLPQVNGSGEYQHYFKGSPASSSTTTTTSAPGTRNDEFSLLGLQASQVIYNNDVLQAAKAAKYSRQYYKENVFSSQVNVVSDVSKAFFDVLLSQKQLPITGTRPACRTRLITNRLLFH
jgi:hypothetical protein